MEDVIKKVQKLLKLEESASKIGSLEEAANAAAKARDLLMKHNLDMYTVSQYEDRPKEEEIGHGVYNTATISPKTEGRWVRDLAHVIAEANMCSLIGTGTARGIVYIVGTKTNVIVTWYTTEQLINRLRPMARKAFKEYDGFEKQNTFIRGYYVGAVAGIAKRLAEDKAREAYEAMEQRRSGNTTSSEVMRVSMAIEQRRKVEDYSKEMFNSRTKAIVPQTSSKSGLMRGHADGYNMGVSKGLSENQNITKRLG